MAGKTHVVSIRVNEDGDFCYDPSVKNIKRGQSVTWTSTQGPFALSFRSRTPVSQIHLQSKKAGSANAWSITSRPAKVSEPGHFHYAVALCMDGKVYLDASCPEIVVGT